MVGPAVKREAVAHLQAVMGLFSPRGDGDWDYVFDAASVELMAMGKLVTTANQGPDLARWTENHSVISIT